MKFRVEFKIALLVFKTLNGLAPQYLSELLVVKPRTRYSLQSDSETLLVIHKVTQKTFGDRAFSHAGPTVWNALPSSLRNCRNIDSFKVQLKTYLLRKLLICNFIFLLLLLFLPSSLGNCMNIDSFKVQLKTYLFKKAFNL